MANSITYPEQGPVNNVLLAEWSLGNGEAGERLKSANFADQNVHFHGVFSTGGMVQLRGSNKADPDADVAEDWFVVHAGHDGSLISLVTTYYGAVILESVVWLSPLCTGGDGSTLIKCSVKANKGK